MRTKPSVYCTLVILFTVDSLTFTPGRARLLSISPATPGQDNRLAVVFEDEGLAAYCYACDGSLGEGEDSIADSMLIYNVASLEEPVRERLASVQWSRSGQQAMFYLDGVPQAFVDFTARQSFCRSNFPNFLEQPGDRWRKSSHAWEEEALVRFEADLLQ